MTYTIILLSIALAVSVGFWIRADRMAAHYRRERDADEDEWSDMMRQENRRMLEAVDIAGHAKEYLVATQRELVATRRQLAAARGQVTKLRKRLESQDE